MLAISYRPLTTQAHKSENWTQDSSDSEWIKVLMLCAQVISRVGPYSAGENIAFKDSGSILRGIVEQLR